MAPIRKVSNRQLQLLVELAMQNPEVALNSCRGSGPLGHQRQFYLHDDPNYLGASSQIEMVVEPLHAMEEDSTNTELEILIEMPTTIPIQPAELTLVSFQNRGISRPQPSVSGQRPSCGTPRTSHDANAPQWAYDLEERRITTEEHIASAVERIEGRLSVVERTEGWLQEIAASQDELNNTVTAGWSAIMSCTHDLHS